MEHARPPSELCGNGQMDVNWSDWRQEFLRFLKASGTFDKPADVKGCLLMNFIGPIGKEAWKTFHFDPPEESENMDTLIEKFNKYFGSEVSEIQRRNQFLSSTRKKAESIEEYVDSLKLKARTCSFGEQTEMLIRDKIILDIKNRVLKKYLLAESNLNLEQLIDLLKRHETEEKLIPLKKASNIGMKSAAYNQPNNNGNGNCIKCGTRHDPELCPAHGKKCGNCGMMHHLTKLCVKPAVEMVKNVGKKGNNQATTPVKHFNPGPFVSIPREYRKSLKDQ